MIAVEIMQDCEVDDDGDIGGWLDVFWAEGHGHDAETFIRARFVLAGLKRQEEAA